MRKFSSYGPLDTDLHFYASREKLISKAHILLQGEDYTKGGHYITVWGPRQTGKTWIMQRVLLALRNDDRFEVVKINLEHLKMEKDVINILDAISEEIMLELNKKKANINSVNQFQKLFKKDVLDKPLILILDEFDALAEDAISAIVGVFRNIYIHRQDESNVSAERKSYLLHGVALIGIRSALGIENVKGSPFNVQKSLHIPNLEFNEVNDMFKWYMKESGQKVEQKVIEMLYQELNGQPGLTSWLGELLTEGYDSFHVDPGKPIIMDNFKEIYLAAVDILPNNNILNIISKARQKPHKDMVLEMFKTGEKIKFKYDDPNMNFLFMNGILDFTKDKKELYVKFSCPYIQKRLFNYFSHELFHYMGKLYEPFENFDDIITDKMLNIRNLMRRYQEYLNKNRNWLLKDAPRRKDLRIYEAVFHFSLYAYLSNFLENRKGKVFPEFPTGNGKIDLIIQYIGQTYGIEIKSFTNEFGYKEALNQAVLYGKQLGIKVVFLVFFIEYISDKNRDKYEDDYLDKKNGIKVSTIFIETEK